jgi:hypothetical protein
LLVDARPRRPNGDARRERCADLRVAGYLSILILPSEFEKHAKRSILFSPLLHVSLSGQHRRRNGIKSYSVRDKELFRFVASFGRDKGYCLPKQGDSRTIL